MPISQELKLYNSLTRSIEPLKVTRELFGFYCCGPTVYGRAHIGNFRTFVCTDLLVRTLRAFGYPLKFVMNLTDVDDKTIRGARESGLSLEQFTPQHIESFHKDQQTLSILPPDKEVRATDHIKAMIDLVGKLMEHGHAYLADDGSVYYRIESFAHYGCLSHLDRQGLRAGARVDNDEYEKESSADFALWKKHRPEDGDAVWDSPWGPGRPGWHLECSAMSMQYLGKTYELHGGGVDLLFPHHENEIAQSEAATGKPFVQHWWHVAHLQVDGRKMSKSLGNLYTLDDVLKKGFTGREIRYTLISGHYREPFNFTWATLNGAREALSRLDNFSIRLHELAAANHSPTPSKNTGTDAPTPALLEKKIFDSLQNDLNISAALGELFTVVRIVNVALDEKTLSNAQAKEWIAVLTKLDAVLGLNLGKAAAASLPSEIEEMVKQRDAARHNKNWAESDRLRKELTQHGWIVEDTPLGTRVKPGR